MTMKVNTPAGWSDGTPSKINTPAGWQSVQKVQVATPEGWKQVWPEESVPPYLYDVTIEYKGNHVVDFTALSGFVHTDPTEEAYMFRCAESSSLNGYVGKNFTKTFPVTAYAKYNCTLQDVSGDLGDQSLSKTISFTVDNK
jgi:hypothetical protein